MYINLKLAKAKDIHLSKIISLQLLKQAKTSDVSEELENYCGAGGLEQLIEEGFVDLIKSKKNTTLFHLARLSKKGAALLEDIQIPEVEESDLTIFEWLKNTYLSSEREIGNAKKTKLWIALFRVNSGIEKNCLAFLLQTFLNDEDNFKYSQRLEYLFFKPSNMYEKFDVEQSRLYQYYTNRKSYFDKQFEKYE